MTSRILDGRRIFLVEDDILNVGVFSKALAKQGAQVFQDVLGYGIIQHIVEQLPIDLVVLDIMLRRGQNGYEILEKMRETPRLHDIPVVIVTSHDPETNIQRAQFLGVNGFISKPINAIEFPNQIERIINGEKLWLVSR